MKFVRKLFAFLVIALMAVILPAQTVMAQFTEISCDTAGVATGGIFDPAIVIASSGPVDPSNPCGLATGRIFSSIACHYIIILNDVFSKFFCALQFGMKDMIMTVVTLFIVLYGARLLIGTQEATGGAIILALLKISIVFLFATQGTLGVSIIYHFFIALIEQTVNWVFAGINCPTVICLTTGSTASIFSNLDDKINSVLMGTMDTTVTPNVMRNGLFVEKSELVFFIIALILIAFPLFMMAWSLIKMTITVFVSALVTFMLSITAVAFLISLSPIFMSFMLFNTTYSLFDNWLKFLVSYSLQPMIIFAILALWLNTADDFLGFVGQLSRVMTIVSADSKDKVGVLTIEDTVKFCPIYYGNNPSTIDYLSVSPFMNITLGGPTIKCCTLTSTNPLVCSLVEPTTPEDPNLMPKENLITPEAMIRESKFLYFLGYHFIALTTIGYAFLHLMKMTPRIAQALSKSQSQMPLGAGFGHGGGLSSMISQATNKGRAKVADVTERVGNRFAAQTSER